MAEEPEARSVDETPAQAAKTLSDEAVKLTETKTLPEQQLPGTIQTTAPTEYRNKMQILIVSLIGLLSLVALLVSYSLKNESSGFVSTVSQLRDFVSTCIGFLISYRKMRLRKFKYPVLWQAILQKALDPGGVLRLSGVLWRYHRPI